MTNPITWNASADKKFESGIHKGVLYVKDSAGDYPLGVGWEGLISVTEKPGGAEPTDLWANNVKYAQLVSAETFDGTIEAYTYPFEFLACDGMEEAETGAVLSQQARTPFGLSYVSYVGSDAGGQMESYKIHIVYGAKVQPSEVSHSTLNDSPEAAALSWEFQTTPETVTGYSSVSKITLDSAKLGAAALTAIEEALYGDGTEDPYLPSPDALLVLAATV